MRGILCALVVAVAGKIARVDIGLSNTEVYISAASASSGHMNLDSVPELPRQFYGMLVVVAHLVNKTEDYPPWRRRVEVFYDYPKRLAKSVVLEGLGANKTFLRRWDTKDEYMYRTTGAFTVNGRTVRRWQREDFPARQTLHVDTETGVPISITDEFYEEPGAASAPPLEYEGMDISGREKAGPDSPTAGTWTPVMTYTWERIVVGPQETWPVEEKARAGLWEVPSPWSTSTSDSCARHMGGWPYLHLFHTFLRV